MRTSTSLDALFDAGLGVEHAISGRAAATGPRPAFAWGGRCRACFDGGYQTQCYFFTGTPDTNASVCQTCGHALGFHE